MPMTSFQGYRGGGSGGSVTAERVLPVADGRAPPPPPAAADPVLRREAS
jgi:hypothetical protein